MKPIDHKLRFGERCEASGCDQYATVVVAHAITASHYLRPLASKPGRPAVVVKAGHAHLYCREHCPAYVRPDLTAPVDAGSCEDSPG